jgi:predicted alpha-1,2-mannosidase
VATALSFCFGSLLLNAQVALQVDPFLGTEGGGNTIPGPSLPFGMIKPGPDVGSDQSNAGWEPSGKINGFSQTHVSGTGGGPKYGNILVQPTVGAPTASGYGSERENEQAALGFYRVGLQRYRVQAEITAARRTALYRFTYPSAPQANLLFDAGHCLTWISKEGEGQFVVASRASVLSATEVSGFTSVVGGWNKQTKPYTVYFYAVSDTPAQSWGTWRNGRLSPGVRTEPGDDAGTSGAWISFPTKAGQQVMLKVAISFKSIEQAKQNAASEIPDFDFNRVRADAVAAWEDFLGKIELTGATTDQKQMFYTALYHTLLMPVDRSGENPAWQSGEPYGEPYYDDFYAIWDTFRTSGPLLTLIAPDREVGIVRALIDIYRHEGWLPDARSGNSTGRTQGGSNAEFLLADAFVKHLTGIDWADAYEGMVKDAEISPPDQTMEGRGGLEDWKRLGYVTIEGVDRPGSKQMEYAADDFEIALVAKGLGRQADFTKYLNRSENWKKLWDGNFKEGGIQGFIRPRHSDGSWKKSFTAEQSCSWGGDTFYEGNSWTYSQFVPQDVGGLIRQSGGPQRFVERLDAFFDRPGRYDVGNEPGFLSPYLYIWAGRQDKTAERLRQIIGKYFHVGRQGLPGNDDSGAMSSWLAFGMMGFFPNAGQDVYLIGSPLVPQVTIHLANGKNFVIEAENFSPTKLYVVGAELNGRTLDRAWFRHEDITDGGRLVLKMSATPGLWPSGDPPPSSSDRR